MPAIIRTPLQPPKMDDLKERDLAACEPKRLLDEKRSEANRRERSRVKALTDNFDDLLQVIPRDVAEPRLARIEIVRRAGGYIRFLTDLLNSERPEDMSAARYPNVWDMVPNEEDDLSSSVLRNAFLNMRGGVTLLPMKRVECNARARSRSKETKAAFQTLKEKLPLHGAEPELSRLEILHRATDYIACMTVLLQEHATEIETGPKTADTPLAWPTASNEGKLSLNLADDNLDRLFSSSGESDTTAASAESTVLYRDSYSSRSSSDWRCTASMSSPPTDSDYASCSTTSPTSVCSESFFSFDDVSSTTTSCSQARCSPCTSPTFAGRSLMTHSRRLAHPYSRKLSISSSTSYSRGSRTPSPYDPVFPDRSLLDLPLTTAPLSCESSPGLDCTGADWLDELSCGPEEEAHAQTLPVTPSLTLLHL